MATGQVDAALPARGRACNNRQRVLKCLICRTSQSNINAVSHARPKHAWLHMLAKPQALAEP